MPDFERTLDEIRLDIAETPEERARAEGFIAGKNYARLEIALVVLFLFIVLLVSYAAASGA